MFPIWLILGVVLILVGIFNKQLLRKLGIKPVSVMMTTPNLMYSSKIVEKFGRWVVITLGLSFLVLGLGSVLPAKISQIISFFLLGLSGFMILAMIGITIVNWKAK